MLHLFTRRVALSTHRATATYTRILPSSHSLRSRSIPGNGLTPSTVQVFVNSQRNASTEATAATGEAKSSAKSGTTGRKEPKKVAALKAKPEGQAAKKKEAKKAKQKQKAKEAKEPKLIKPPPRIMSPMALFAQEEKLRPSTELSDGWRNLSEEVKQDYVTRAKAVREKRKEEYGSFMKTVTVEDIRRYNRHQKSKGRKCIRTKPEGYRPKLNQYMTFYQEFRLRPEQAGRPMIEVAKVAGEAWRSLTQEEKAQYSHKPNESSTA